MVGSPVSSRSLPLVIVVASACVVGVGVARTSVELVLVLLVAAIALFGLIGMRAIFMPQRGDRDSDVDESPVDSRLKLPRLLFYAGAASIGFLTVRPAAGLTLSDLIFFLALAVTGLTVLHDRLRRDYYVPQGITVGVAILALGGLLSSFGSDDGSQSVAILLRLLYLTLVWFWLGTIVLENRRHVENAVLCWVSSAALSSAGAVGQYFYGDVIPGGEVAWGRMSGFTPHTNNLAGLAATAFVPALMVAVDSSSRTRKLVGVAAVASISAGMLLSGSVGGFLSASVATLVWLALRGVSQRLVISLAAIVAAVFLLMSASGSTLAPAPIERFQQVTSQSGVDSQAQGSIFTRIEGYREAWSRIRENPVIGVGLDEESNSRILEGHFVHNIVVNPWFSAGIFGVVGIITIIVGGFTTAFFVVRRSSSRAVELGTAMLAAYVAFVVFAMGEPILFVRYGWFPVAMLIALRAQFLRAGATERTDSSRRVERRLGHSRAAVS